jgi:isoleucyl-tRNA synthetase
VVDEVLIYQMEKIRDISARVLKIRQEKSIKVRQPLRAVILKEKIEMSDELWNILKDEVNIKNVEFDSNIENDMELYINLTTELINEGRYRELIRLIQDLRQESNYSPNDMIDLAIVIDAKDDF